MADAKKCDRCGKLFEPYLVQSGFIDPRKFTELSVMEMDMDKVVNEREYFDLCDECHESFKNWLFKRTYSCFGKYETGDNDCAKCPRMDECEKTVKMLER